MILLLAACATGATAAHPPALPTGDPAAPFAAADAEARRRVPDPARGGPLLPGDASPLPPFEGVDRGVATYTGPAACLGCHAAAAAAWSPTPHAGAFGALVARERSHDPGCARCHVTGAGSPGGYAGGGPEGPTGALAAVTCEACHGPGSMHVQAGGATTGATYGRLPASAAACVACHTWENSPDFTWDAYWPRVRH